jgi:hypothetical protein
VRLNGTFYLWHELLVSDADVSIELPAGGPKTSTNQRYILSKRSFPSVAPRYDSAADLQ